MRKEFTDETKQEIFINTQKAIAIAKMLSKEIFEGDGMGIDIGVAMDVIIEYIDKIDQAIAPCM